MSDDTYHHGSHLPVRGYYDVLADAFVIFGFLFWAACMICLGALICMSLPS